MSYNFTLKIPCLVKIILRCFIVSTIANGIPFLISILYISLLVNNKATSFFRVTFIPRASLNLLLNFNSWGFCGFGRF